MTAFVYVIAEGVQDVAFLGRVLRALRGAKQVQSLEDVDEPRKAWFQACSRWPVGGKIDRLAVPAPILLRGPGDLLVGLRNAEGLSKVAATIQDDLDLLTRAGPGPEAVGVVLDSDDEPPDVRHGRLLERLAEIGLPVQEWPRALGEVRSTIPRCGVYSVPDPGRMGTIEDLLLELGAIAYPALHAAATGYIEDWLARLGDSPGADWKPLRKPAGAKKATVGAMSALLKPGKAVQASIHDNAWVGEATQAAPGLQPLLVFLDALLGVQASPGGPEGEPPGV